MRYFSFTHNLRHKLPIIILLFSSLIHLIYTRVKSRANAKNTKWTLNKLKDTTIQMPYYCCLYMNALVISSEKTSAFRLNLKWITTFMISLLKLMLFFASINRLFFLSLFLSLSKSAFFCFNALKITISL